MGGADPFPQSHLGAIFKHPQPEVWGEDPWGGTSKALPHTGRGKGSAVGWRSSESDRDFLSRVLFCSGQKGGRERTFLGLSQFGQKRSLTSQFQLSWISVPHIFSRAFLLLTAPIKYLLMWPFMYYLIVPNLMSDILLAANSPESSAQQIFSSFR